MNKGQLNTGAWEVLAAVRNLMFKYSIIFSQRRTTTCWMMQWATCRSCEWAMATALSHSCGLCGGTEGKEQCHPPKYPQQEYRAAAPFLLRVPLWWVWLFKETMYCANELCTAHGCPAWRRDVCAWYNPGLTEDGCEVGASMCLVLGAVGNKCRVLNYS